MAKKTSVTRSTLNRSAKVNVTPAGRSLAFADRKPAGASDAGPGRTIVVHTQQIGSSGVRNFSGYPSEEYFQKLRGHLAADIFDQMRRGESQIKMCLSAVGNPIKSATWEFSPASEESGIADRQKHADFMKFVMFKDMKRSFTQFLTEALTSVAFGHSVFEIVHKNVVNHSKWGAYTGINLLGWRSPRTIYRWHLDKEEGAGLDHITQYAFGDLQRLVDIPGEFLMVITLDQEGDNYDGISGLRAAYGPWFRKQEYLVMQAIGIEKFAIPTPIGKIPDGLQNSEQAANFEAALQAFTAHDKSYMTIPAGDWAVDFVGANGKGGFDPEKLQKAIDAEDRNIVKAFVANFLELGGASSSGSWALSFDQSSFFKSSIEHIANLIAESVNKRVVKPLIDMNFGVQEEYPMLMHSGITDEAGKELAEALERLCQSQVVIPDDDLEDHVRKRYRLSPRSENGQRKVVAKGALGGGDATKEDDATGTTFASRRKAILLAEKIGKKQIGEGADLLNVAMSQGLRDIGSQVVRQVMAAYRQAQPAQRVNCAKLERVPGSTGYKAKLVQILTDISGKALKQARREVPKAKNVKLADLNFADTFRMSDLPPALQQKIRTKAQMLTDSQLADLDKAVAFQFQASVDSTDSESRIEADLEEAVDKLADGASVLAAAGNAAAHAVNDSRNAFFFDDDVLEEIESFTFTNGDPVSPICQDLAGTTFDKDDPDAARYFPPLHHNCKSYIVPNLAGAKDNPEIDDDGLKPSDPSLEASITLHES